MLNSGNTMGCGYSPFHGAIRNNRLPVSVKKLYNKARQIIETVNGHLSEQFNIEKNHAHTCWGLCARVFQVDRSRTVYLYQSPFGEARFPNQGLGFPQLAQGHYCKCFEFAFYWLFMSIRNGAINGWPYTVENLEQKRGAN